MTEPLMLLDRLGSILEGHVGLQIMHSTPSTPDAHRLQSVKM